MSSNFCKSRISWKSDYFFSAAPTAQNGPRMKISDWKCVSRYICSLICDTTVTFGYVHQSSDGCGISGKFRNIMNPIHSIPNEKIYCLLQTIQTSEPHHSTISNIQGFPVSAVCWSQVTTLCEKPNWGLI